MKFVRQSFIQLSVAFLLSGCMSSGVTMRGDVSPDTLWTREELYFGTNIAGGGNVSDAQWQSFLDEEVTSRFPSGLTVVNGSGQYLHSNGNRVSEQTKIVILLYQKDEAKNAHMIDEVIDRYKSRFRQESVLRIKNRVSARFQ